jgi:hypothetical protein
MADLPLVLLGPIVRRVEPRHVSVFVATSKSANVRLALFDGQVDAESPPPELAAKETHTTRFAAAFHAIVVTVDLTDAAAPLQPGHQYSYDIRITSDAGTPQTLKDLKFLEDDDETIKGYAKTGPASGKVEVDAIGYADNRLPSFVTCPASLDELVIAHASCRKPHGDGHPALQWIDSYIDDLHGAIDGRPHMLFLTGDQIYADDVAAALLPGLSDLGIALLDGVEEVPSPVDNSKTIKVNTTELPAGFRQRVTGKSGFTSDWAASHLIGFGEFLAMYCAAWNPYLWPVLAVADTSDPGLADGDLKDGLVKDAANLALGVQPQTVLGRPSPDAPADVITPLYGGTQPEADALKHAREEFVPSKRLLDEFRREVSRVRRLLANVPTYMICDDHDVTDDWFMTGQIRRETLDNLFGRALIRNALAAHTICQAWGNVPQLWNDDDDHRILLEGIAGMFPESWNGDGPPDPDGVKAVVDTLGLEPTAQPKFDFSFSVDGPMHKVRVLDTRTRREYDTPKKPPGLLTVAALDTQLPLQELEQLPDDHPLIVVSPAPVFGPPVLNEIGGPILVEKHDLVDIAWSESDRSLNQEVTGIEYGTPAGLQYYDIEHWGAHPAAFERLLERLSRHPRVIVLGGDVHYGAAYAMDWTGDGRTGRIVHFTSSAAKNDWKDSAAHLGSPGIVHNLFALNGMATGLQKIGFPMTRLGWSATLPPVVADLEKEPPSTRLRVQTGPVVLSNEFFREQHTLTRPPDWVWRAAPIVDVRAPADRPPAARVTEPAADLPNDGGAVRQYGALAATHVQALRTAAVARGLQFLNNVGLIRFATAGDGIHVSQALYSLRSREDPNEKGDAYVVYETTLEPAPVPTPNTVGPGA